MNAGYVFLMIGLLALGTMITRFLPFVLFPAGKKQPKFLEYLGKNLPYAAMGLLVVYCLKGVNLSEGTRGIPEFLAVIVTAGLQAWKKNSLLSIGAGTLFYMSVLRIISSGSIF